MKVTCIAAVVVGIAGCALGPDAILEGTLVGILNPSEGLVLCADRRLSTTAGTVVAETDVKIQAIGIGAASFTTGLTAIVGGREGRIVFDATSSIRQGITGLPTTRLKEAVPRVGRALGRSLEEYLRSRPPAAWPAPGTPLSTVGLVWFDNAGQPSIAALTLSNRSVSAVSVSVDATLWGPNQLAVLNPLFFGRIELAAAVANGEEAEWEAIRQRPLFSKILDDSTRRADLSVPEAEEFLREMIRLASVDDPTILGLPATVGSTSLCYYLRAAGALQPLP